MPLLLLFGISVTGLMLTVSYTWMKGYAYDFLAILHAATVIITLLWLPFGKLFHVFQRPAQLGVGFYKAAGVRGEQARCRRCGGPYASAMLVRDLIVVEKDLGFTYDMPGGGHYGAVIGSWSLSTSCSSTTGCPTRTTWACSRRSAGSFRAVPSS